MKTRIVVTTLVRSLVVAASLALAACAAAPTAVPPTPVPPTEMPPTAMAATEAPTAAPVVPITGGTPAAASGPITLMLANNSSLGSILADGSDRTLYAFTKDTKDTSNCYDACAQAWPPLLSSGQVTVTGTLDGSLLGSTQRKDGTTQVTFNHWPLYYYGADKNVADTNGQGVAKVWWVVSGEGNLIRSAAAVHIVTVAGVGKYLVDADGFTLYVFSKDSTGATTCYGKCEAAWPPLLTVGAPTAGDGANATLLGTLTRKDGSMQVTFGGMPLYYFAADQKAGDTKGQGVGSVWFIVGPKANVMKAAPEPTPTP